MKNSGNFSRQHNGYQVVFDRLLHHPVQKVWDAISSPEQLKYWFTDIEMELKPGSKIVIRFRDKDRTETYGEVVRVDPPYYLAWTWEGELAEWKLEKIDEHTTRLQFTYSKMAGDYAVQTPAGFHILLDRLESRLNGNEEIYPFGTEEKSEDSIRLQVMYAEKIFQQYPEAMKYPPVVVEKIYDVPAALVWNAISRKEELDQWYFKLDDFKAEPGYRFRFEGQGSKGEKYMHNCEITEVIPGSKLQYSWQYDGYEGYSLVSFELHPEGDKTKLVIIHHGLWSFPQDLEDFSPASFSQGWNHIAGIDLQAYLEKGEPQRQGGKEV